MLLSVERKHIEMIGLNDATVAYHLCAYRQDRQKFSSAPDNWEKVLQSMVVCLAKEKANLLKQLVDAKMREVPPIVVDPVREHSPGDNASTPVE